MIVTSIIGITSENNISSSAALDSAPVHTSCTFWLPPLRQHHQTVFGMLLVGLNLIEQHATTGESALLAQFIVFVTWQQRSALV